VQRLPGTTTNGFSSIGSVRGGEPNETAIVLDGLRLYEPFHLKNFLSPVSLLDSRIIDSIEFYSGGFPVDYGDRMSAIIDATTVRPAEPLYFELGLNLFHASGLAAAQFADGKGHALLSARRSNVGDLADLSENDFRQAAILGRVRPRRLRVQRQYAGRRSRRWCRATSSMRGRTRASRTRTRSTATSTRGQRSITTGRAARRAG
jgi:hypothetical protein